MVTVAWRCAGSAMVLGLLLFGAFACSPFDPVKVKRFQLLYEDTYEALGMSGARWVEYDDQHSLTSACTNGAAGDHLPSECSLVYAEWDSGAGGDGSGGAGGDGSGGEAGIPKRRNPKCPPTKDELDKVVIAAPGADGSICISGVLHPYQACKHDADQCFAPTGVDQSYMWGAGVGLAFQTPWDATDQNVRGIAFDFRGPEETRGIMRVEVPIQLGGDTQVPETRPLIRSDGAVLGTDGKVHGCADNEVSEPVVERCDTKLSDALVGADKNGIVSSLLHPYGSPFWQQQVDPDKPMWTFSPVRHGHNEVEWGDIRPPPEARLRTSKCAEKAKSMGPDPNNYSFSKTQIMGIHFQVSYPPGVSQADLHFQFCIEKLAVLFKE